MDRWRACEACAEVGEPGALEGKGCAGRGEAFARAGEGVAAQQEVFRAA